MLAANEFQGSTKSNWPVVGWYTYRYQRSANANGVGFYRGSSFVAGLHLFLLHQIPVQVRANNTGEFLRVIVSARIEQIVNHMKLKRILLKKVNHNWARGSHSNSDDKKAIVEKA